MSDEAAVKQNGGANEDGMSSNYLASLPTQVKRRIKALKKLQVDHFKVLGDFYKDAAVLENKYFAKYNEIMNKRAEIVTGKYEPNDEDCKYVEPNEGLAAELEKVSIDDKDVKGVPSFWLTVMKNAVDDTNDFIIEADEPLLEFLRDITIEDQVDSFKLVFHFDPNEYFTNETLTKEFKLKLGPVDEDPFSFDGPEIVAMKGCTINWTSEEKNVTQKKVTKKQRNKKSHTTRVITKTIPTDSFFKFFNQPAGVEWVEEKDGMDEDLQEAFSVDTSLGSFFRERLVPRAVLYFTGEIAAYSAYDEADEDLDFDEDAGV